MFYHWGSKKGNYEYGIYHKKVMAVKFKIENPCSDNNNFHFVPKPDRTRSEYG